MASSSTSTSTSHSVNNDYVFDVFISHRGPDVKKTLATHLYRRLCKHDLQVFLDEQELRAGDTVNPQLESAVTTSSVNVAIFSPNYAESKWCLDDELLNMVDSMSKYKSTIIPVFFGVTPAEVRWRQDGQGVYAQALYKLQGRKTFDGQHRHDSEIIEKWRRKRDRVIRILNRTGWEGTLGLWKLENRCLVQVDSENRLRMHDHVRDMGRYLAEKEPPDVSFGFGTQLPTFFISFPANYLCVELAW